MKRKLESRLPGRNSNNLKYTDDTTLTAESEEKLKSLLMKVKVESEKVGLLHITHRASLSLHKNPRKEISSFHR